MSNPELFSSVNDANASGQNFNDLDQLAAHSNILSVERDSVSSLEKVVVGDGPFEFSTYSYINDTIKDYITVETRALNNQQFPVNVSNSTKFDCVVDIKNEYFLFPASLSLTCEFELSVVNAKGEKRAILDYDRLVALDGCMPVKNIYPCLDDQCTVMQNKTIDQRAFSRIITTLSQTLDAQAVNRRKKHRLYFEGETVTNNKLGKTRSHKWDPSAVGKIKLYPLDNTPTAASKQNVTLAHTLKEPFMCPLDLTQTPPFNSAVIYSRPCSRITFTLDFGMFSEWLRIATPDGVKPTDYVAPNGVLQSNFSNLQMEIRGVYVSYTQFSLHNKLLEKYKNATIAERISNQSQQTVEIHKVTSPLQASYTSWSHMLFNIIVPERLYITFVSKQNKNNGNPMFFQNLGVTKILFQVLSSSSNRYNQSRKSAFNIDNDCAVSTTAQYRALKLNEKFKADLFVNDMILKPAQLAVGQPETGRNSRKVYLMNEDSVYRGNCIYVINTGIQVVTNKHLKEETTRGNIEITFEFKEGLPEDYYCTVYCGYPGEFIVSTASPRRFLTKLPFANAKLKNRKQKNKTKKNSILKFN